MRRETTREDFDQVYEIYMDETVNPYVNFEVMGKGYVAIYDSNRVVGTDGSFYFLAPGDRFNLKTREPSREMHSSEPFDEIFSNASPES